MSRRGRLVNVFVITQVNDTSVENVTHAEAVDALKKAGSSVKLVRMYMYIKLYYKTSL